MIKYSNEDWLGGLVFRCHGSVIPLSLLCALIPACLAAFLVRLNFDWDDLETHYGGEQIRASQLWGGLTGVLMFLIAFRTNKAYGRFWDGTTLLHRMWGEWFDACSCLTSFSSLSLKTMPNEVDDFRHTLIRLMSLCHASALQEIAIIYDEIAHIDTPGKGYRVLDLGGLDQSTLRYLRKCTVEADLKFNRTEVLVHMIQMLVVHAQNSGVLQIAPPILSRVFQSISRGQVSLANCKKITTTWFPFPYAQLIAVLLLCVSLLAAPVMACLCEKEHWAFIFTLFPVFGLFAVNNIARELEMPFGKDPNDLPLEHFQAVMNKSLLMLIRGEADLIPTTSERCQREFDSILNNTSSGPLSEYIEEEKEKKDIEEEHGKRVDRKPANGIALPASSILVETCAASPHLPPVAAVPISSLTVSTAHAGPSSEATTTSETVALARTLQTSLEMLNEKMEAAITSIPIVEKCVNQNSAMASQLLESLQWSAKSSMISGYALSEPASIVEHKAGAFAISGCCSQDPLPPKTPRTSVVIGNAWGA